MARSIITISKFVGTVSLGLLTGLNYGVSTLSLPSLLLLPSAPAANTAFENLRSSAAFQTHILSAVSFSGLVLAFAVSPPRGRHPYLLWTALVLGLGQGLEVFARKRAGDREVTNRARRVEEEVNGEQVKAEMEQWKITKSLSAALNGVAFAMSVVGIWGDRF